MDEFHNHKHKFKFLGVEDYFLYQQLRWVCQNCFIECFTEKKEFYSILRGEPAEIDRPDLWR